MSLATRYLFIASMDVAPEKEDFFNEVYDTEHVPTLLKVAGVHAVTRLKAEPFAIAMGGNVNEVGTEGIPRYAAFYEIDGPEVLQSEAWAEAVELGRWPEQVRPYTSNRRHELRKII